MLVKLYETNVASIAYDGKSIAYDVLVYGAKESLSFNAVNAAKAHVFDLLDTWWGLSADLLTTGYLKIEEHPNFPSLVAFVRTHQGYPAGKELRDAMADISFSIVLDLAEELTGSQALTEASFFINTKEIMGGAEVSAVMWIWEDGLFLNGATSGTLELPRPLTAGEPLMLVKLYKADGALVADDMLIYGVKESLTFDATNAAKGLVMFLLSDSTLSTDRLITIYSKIEEHPDFPNLVGFIRTYKGYPDGDALLDDMIDISFPIINDLVAELDDTQEPTGSFPP